MQMILCWTYYEARPSRSRPGVNPWEKNKCDAEFAYTKTEAKRRDKLENVQRLRVAAISSPSLRRLNDGHPGKNEELERGKQTNEERVTQFIVAIFLDVVVVIRPIRPVNFTLSSHTISSTLISFPLVCLRITRSISFFFLLLFVCSSFSFRFVPFILFYEH